MVKKRTSRDINKSEPSSPGNDLLAEIRKLNNKMDKFKDDIINELKAEVSKLNIEIQQLNDQNSLLQKSNDDQELKIRNLEISQSSLEQYGRRVNIEIAGIPDSVGDKDLLNEVMEICQDIGVIVEPADVVACHRLPKSTTKTKLPKRTIVRFYDRNICDELKSKRNVLKEKRKNIYINDNLCRTYKSLWWHCRKLHERKRIHSYWINNGVVTIRITQETPAKKILHFHTLCELFPNFNFHED